MHKFKKLLVALASCLMALLMVFAAGCNNVTINNTNTNNSGSSGSSGSSSEEANTSTGDTTSDNESTGDNNAADDDQSNEGGSGDGSGSGSGDGSGSGSNDDDDDSNFNYTSTTVYFVGDSTVCSFSDTYYLPRYGYGTQFINYVDTNYVSVENLALSGRSSLSFTSETNYDVLWNGGTNTNTDKTVEAIGEGDYLIIGFGHNDEKYDDSTRYTAPTLDAVDTAGSFQNILYYKYIKLALDVGATPILCTPIVRYNSNNDYSGSSGHYVSGYGDYAACILDLASDYDITCVDLTSITKALYEDLKEDAQWYHCFTKATISADSSARTVKLKGSETGETVKVVPAGMDSTHLNKYGAKMVAYNIASALRTDRKECSLGYYVKSDITEPTEDDLEDAYNASYEYKPYSAPTLANYESLGSVTDSQDNTTKYNLYSTVFGEVGGESKLKNYTFTNTNDVYKIDNSSSNNGKLTATKDGLGAIFMQVDITKKFTASVKVKIVTVGSGATGESGFGLMIRDDIYMNEYDTSISSNYITAGLIDKSSGYANFYKENDAITQGTKVAAMAADDEYTLTISGGGQIFDITVTTSSGTPYTATVTDLKLNGIDENYAYLCMFAARGLAVEFSNFTFAITGDAQSA